MNNYLFLISEREHGNFNEYLHRGLIGSNLLLWLDIYEFHRTNPTASTWDVANEFGVGQTHVRRIYEFMEDGDKK